MRWGAGASDTAEPFEELVAGRMGDTLRDEARSTPDIIIGHILASELRASFVPLPHILQIQTAHVAEAIQYWPRRHTCEIGNSHYYRLSDIHPYAGIFTRRVICPLLSQ
jgi:hypothetical protein